MSEYKQIFVSYEKQKTHLSERQVRLYLKSITVTSFLHHEDFACKQP